MTTFVHLQYLEVIVLYNWDGFNREIRNESEESNDLNVKLFIIDRKSPRLRLMFTEHLLYKL